MVLCIGVAERILKKGGVADLESDRAILASDFSVMGKCKLGLILKPKTKIKYTTKNEADDSENVQ